MKFGTDWNWFDLAILFLLVFGFIRGRKRGMSTELLPVLQVAATLIAGALLYKVGGDKFFELTNGSMEKWMCYFLVYFAIIIVIHLTFSSIRKAVGEKLVGGDLFGSMEYYLGMVAGVVRYLGITLIVLALFNAKAIDRDAIKKDQKMMKDNFGNISFPTFETLQVDVFEVSMLGKFTRERLPGVLIEPTYPQPKPTKGKPTIAEKKQRALDEAIGGKK